MTRNVITPTLVSRARLGGLAEAQADSGDAFGRAVAIDGDTAVIGVPGKDSTVDDTGAALVFVRTSGVWTLEATLLLAPAAQSPGFGTAVAISGDTIGVGGASKVWVFVRTGGAWTLQATLPSDSASSFGARVAVSGNSIAIGAPGATTVAGSESGAVSVFTRSGSTWTLQQTLLASDTAAYHRLGSGLSLEGDTVLIGAAGAESAYVFSRTGGVWTQSQKLLPSSAASSFGSAVCLSGNRAVVGAPGGGQGSAMVFEQIAGNWSQVAVLNPTSVTPFYSGLGGSVSLSGDVVILGSTDPFGGTALRAFVFRANGGTWDLDTTLSVPPTFTGSVQYAQVASSGGSLLVGASFVDGGGAAFVYTHPSTAWVQQARLDGPGTTRGDRLGSAIAVDGDTMAVGALNDHVPSGVGSVTIFRRLGGVWTPQQKLAPGPSGGTAFGSSIALEGDLLVVTAPSDSPIAAVYVYRNTGTWALEQMLSAPPGDSSFGTAVAAHDGVILVGQATQTSDEAEAGVVSVFGKVGGTWVLQQRLQAPVPTRYQHFGQSVALAGDKAIVGGSGVVHVFRRAAGVFAFTQQLTGAPGEALGSALAVRDDMLAIGAPPSGYNKGRTGSVYLFADSGGSYLLKQRLPAPAIGSYNFNVRFGISVALSQDTLAAGAYSDVASQKPFVAVYSTAAGEWALSQKLLAPDNARTGFATGLGVANGELFVGVPEATVGGSGSGAVDVFGPGSADLSLSMSAPASLTQGGTAALSMTLANAGPDALPGAVVNVSLAPGFLFGSGAGCVPIPGGGGCSLESLPPGSSVPLTLNAVAVGVGTFTTTATVGATGPSAQATSTIQAASADLAVALSADPSARRNDSFYVSMSVRNNGPAIAGGVRMDLVAPPGVLVVGAPCIGGLPCTVSQIGSGSNAGFSVEYFVAADYGGPTPIPITATAAAANADPVPGNNTATASVQLTALNRYLSFYSVVPCRLVDTRDAGRGGPLPLAPGRVTYTAGAGPCGIPYSARALAVNVTVTEAVAAGHLKLYPGDATTTVSSVVNYSAGQTRGNDGLLALDPTSKFVVDVNQAAGTVHVIVDVVGYFQ